MSDSNDSIEETSFASNRAPPSQKPRHQAHKRARPDPPKDRRKVRARLDVEPVLPAKERGVILEVKMISMVRELIEVHARCQEELRQNATPRPVESVERK